MNNSIILPRGVPKHCASGLLVHATALKDQSPTLKIASWNVDMAIREEQVEGYRWIQRRDRVAKQIVALDADIVCLQEMRELDGVEPVQQWLASFAKHGYRFVEGRRNASPLAFGQAILYRPTAVQLLSMQVRWLTVTGYGSIALVAVFAHVHEGKVVSDRRPFSIANVHFPLGTEEEKMAACVMLCEWAYDVVLGDFNIFFDKDGKEQVSILNRVYHEALSFPTDQERRPLFGSFVGYAHDEHHAPDARHPQSMLDHLFFKKDGVTFTNPCIHTRTFVDPEPVELSDRALLPSDHLALSADFTFHV